MSNAFGAAHATTRRRFLHGLAGGSAAVVVSLLTACGATKSLSSVATAQASSGTTAAASSQAATSTQAAVASANTQAAATSASASATAPMAPGATPLPTPVPVVSVGKGSKKLTIWHYYGQAQSTPLAQIVANYAKVDPDLSFELDYTPGANLLQKIQTAIAGDATPDIAQTDLVWVPIMIYSQKTIALDQYFKQEKFDITDFFDALLQYDQGDDGKYYAIPMDTNNIQLFYNKSLVSQAGLDFDKNPPKTWAELTDVSQKLTNQDKKQWGLDLGAETTQGAQGALANRHMCMVWQTGTQYFADKSGHPERGKPVFNSDQGIAAWQWNVDIIQKYKAVPIQPPQQGFVTGYEAIYYTGPWSIPDNLRLIGNRFEMGVMSYPGQTAELAGNSWSGGEHFQAFQGKNQDAAAKFLLWLTSPENIETFNTQAGYIPTRKSVIDGATYKAWLEKNPLYKVFADNMTKVHPRVPTRLFFDLTIAISHHLEDAIYQRQTVHDALNAAVTEASSIMSQNNYQP